MKGAGKVYSYMRFSALKQAAGASFERQAAYAVRWAQENGLPLDSTLTMRDEGLSAYHQKHVKQGALGVFLKAIEADKVPTGSVLVVESLDRLSRAEPLVALAQLTQIINADISVVTAEDNQTYSRTRIKENPMVLLQSILIMVRANEESEKKSGRVSDAIHRKCVAWEEGTYRGAIRVGKIPTWVKYAHGKYELIPERVEAINRILELHRAGKGTTVICKMLATEGLSFTTQLTNTAHLARLLRNENLRGDRTIEIKGQVFHLSGYYPAVVSPEEWDELQRRVDGRGGKYVSSVFPALLTGLRLAFCGYCGTTMKGQTMQNRRKSDGVLTPGNRRFACRAAQESATCPVGSSCSVAPVERAIMDYCSDQMNLRALYGGDQTKSLERAVQAVEAKLAAVDVKLERVTDAMLEAGAKAPATFVKRATELELEQGKLREALAVAQNELKQAQRANIVDADVAYAALAKGVEELDYEARTKARLMIADTFQRIDVFVRGFNAAPSGGYVGIQLRAKGSNIVRRLHINLKSGKWEIGEDIVLDDAADAIPWITPKPGRKPKVLQAA